MKPRVFIGSSVESLPEAYAIQQNLEFDAEVTVWPQGVFRLSKSSLDSLLLVLDTSDFGIFVIKSEDVAKIRGIEHNVARDNVIFELGLFLGRLGVERTFFVQPRDLKELHIPTDLLGITPATYQPGGIGSNLRAALGPACTSISSLIREIGPIRTELTSRDMINKAWISLVAGATRSLRIMSGDASWASRDGEQIAKLTSQGIDVRVLCEHPTENALVKENVRILLSAGASVRYYPKCTRVRAILTDWQTGGSGFAMRIEKTPKTEQQHRKGEPGNAELYNYRAVQYFPPANVQHTESLGLLFDSLYESGTDAVVLDPIQFTHQQIANALAKSGITQYSAITEANIDLVSLSISDLWATCRFVKQPRLSRVQRLVDSHSHGIRRFETVCCASKDGTRVVFPPIVEKNQNRHVVIDGMHRLFSELVVAKKRDVQCLVITNGSPLPSEPLPFSEVSIVTDKRPRPENFRSYHPQHFREMKKLDALLSSGQIITRCTRRRGSRSI